VECWSTAFSLTLVLFVKQGWLIGNHESAESTECLKHPLRLIRVDYRNWGIKDPKDEKDLKALQFMSVMAGKSFSNQFM
jgi:hypothetical protein